MQPQPTFTQPVEQSKPAPQPKDDGKYSNLASLLANRDAGIDTFGNFGNMSKYTVLIPFNCTERYYAHRNSRRHGFRTIQSLGDTTNGNAIECHGFY